MNERNRPYCYPRGISCSELSRRYPRPPRDGAASTKFRGGRATRALASAIADLRCVFSCVWGAGWHWLTSCSATRVACYRARVTGGASIRAHVSRSREERLAIRGERRRHVASFVKCVPACDVLRKRERHARRAEEEEKQRTSRILWTQPHIVTYLDLANTIVRLPRTPAPNNRRDMHARSVRSCS